MKRIIFSNKTINIKDIPFKCIQRRKKNDKQIFVFFSEKPMADLILDFESYSTQSWFVDYLFSSKDLEISVDKNNNGKVNRISEKHLKL